ncbi:MAG TPA: peroxiredoxin [Acidimicrobiia bacterium]|jgi:peroxiredoxin Q/BCP|nr:peroxiredoxin [Acidimicrobiia bacterium]
MLAGDIAPEFTALDQHGQPTSLSELLQNGPAVLFFYPKAFTPGCTAQSCHFRDLDAEFHAVGAQRIGISADSVDRQAAFDEAHGLGFPLLSDPDRKIAKLFGVKRPGPLFNRRKTFVIDSEGTILLAVASEMSMEKHADEALEALRSRAAA